MRPIDKLEKYAKLLAKKYNGDFIECEKSRYFSFNGRVVRISDHIGRNSSGNFSFILTTTKDTYILHSHSTGNVSVVNYKQAKNILNSLIHLFGLSEVLNNNTFVFEKEKEKENIEMVAQLQSLREENKKLRTRVKGMTSNSTKDYVLGFHKNLFTDGQQHQIKLMVNKVKSANS